MSVENGLKPYLGQHVLWFEGGVKDIKRQPFVAVVTRVNQSGDFCNLNLHLIRPDNQVFSVRDGVKHMMDPSLRDAERTMDGAWDFTDQDKQMTNWMRLVEGGIAKGKPVGVP